MKNIQPLLTLGRLDVLKRELTQDGGQPSTEPISVVEFLKVQKPLPYVLLLIQFLLMKICFKQLTIWRLSMGQNRFLNKLMLSISMIISVIVIMSISPSSYAEPIRIQVVYTEWFPYTFQQNGEARGFEIDILRSVLADMNIEGEFTQYPWKRCLHTLKIGTADALVSMLKTKEREEYTHYPETHISLSKTVFCTTTDKKISFDGNYESLSDYRIGIISGFTYGESFDKADYLKKDGVTDVEMLINKLLANRNDIIAENFAVISGRANKMRIESRLKFLTPPIHTQKLFVGFSKTNNLTKMAAEFSLALQQFKSSKRYITIIEKYGLNSKEMLE